MGNEKLTIHGLTGDEIPARMGSATSGEEEKAEKFLYC